MATEVNHKFRDDLSTEYYKIVSIVSDFDKNLLTVKGWGVTLGLAGLALGFQNQHYGLFLVSGVSGIAFWVIEAVMKRHQTRYYARMREIEFISYNLFGVEFVDNLKVSSPQIDWSWAKAVEPLRPDERPGQRPPIMDKPNLSYVRLLRSAHVALPHVITTMVSSLLFVLGAMQILRMPL